MIKPYNHWCQPVIQLTLNLALVQVFHNPSVTGSQSLFHTTKQCGMYCTQMDHHKFDDTLAN